LAFDALKMLSRANRKKTRPAAEKAAALEKQKALIKQDSRRTLANC